MNNVIRIRPPKKGSPDTFQVQAEQTLNTKITRNKIAVAKKEQTPSSKAPKLRHARALNVVEFYMHLFGYPSIMTNIAFEFIPTQPYEERAATERRKPIEDLSDDPSLQNQALTAANTCPSHHIRIARNFPSWRHFTPTQIKKIEDDLLSPLKTDQVTIFGFRPPELRFACRQSQYRRWFSRGLPKQGKLVDLINYCDRELDDALWMSSWIDATTAQIKVRAKAIPEIIDHLLSKPPLDDFGGSVLYRAITLSHFQLLQDAYNYHYHGIYPDSISSQKKLEEDPTIFEQLCHRFICEPNASFLPVIWYRSVRPTQTVRFLIHALLSLGSFTDEYDLFSQPSLRQCFVKARLLDPLEPEKSANQVMKTYLLEQLAILPCGTPTFDRYCVAAYNAFRSLFVDNSLYCDELPTVLYCRLHDQTCEKIVEYQIQKRRALTDSIYSKLQSVGVTGLPDKEKCLQASISKPCHWNLLRDLPKAPAQPVESYEEQQVVFAKGMEQLHAYVDTNNNCTKGMVVVGAGGVGKTTVLLLLLLYAQCLGLSVAITALMSERSQELAGDHINSMFCIPSHDRSLSTGQIAERAISALFKNPEKLELVRCLDVLAWDESQSSPAEYVAVVDIVLRYVRNSNRPFGGVLIFSTMDNLQIEPCQGRHPLLSAFFFSCFIFVRLQHSVRAAYDLAWQRIQAITRLPLDLLKTQQIKEEFIGLLLMFCTWVDSFDKCPPNALFVFGKNEPIRREEERIFEHLKTRLQDSELLVAKAVDYERTIHGNLAQASPATTKSLNYIVKPPEELYFYVGGRYAITGNNKREGYSNSQLAYCHKLPTKEQLRDKAPIEMLVAPPGCRYIPGDDDTAESLVRMGWVPKKIGKCREITHNLPGGIRAYRQQYDLRHYVGCTAHAVMGQTLSSLATKIEKKGQYAVWLASQVVVLLSRTRLAKDTCFVTKNPLRTAEALYEALLQVTPFRAYLSSLLDSLCTGTSMDPEPAIVDQSRTIFRPKDVPLPTDGTGQVYISLVSLRDLNFTYIGSTNDLGRRWDEHNKGFGAEQTAPITLRPYAILAYVTGFDKDESKYVRFENRWIAEKRDYQKNPNVRTTVEGIVNLAAPLLQEYKERFGLDLTLVKCGTFERVKERFVDPN